MATDPELLAFESGSREAIRQLICPHCSALAGEKCRTRGQDREVNHADRTRAYQEAILDKVRERREWWKLWKRGMQK